jgi:hypothetical protein
LICLLTVLPRDVSRRHQYTRSAGLFEVLVPPVICETGSGLGGALPSVRGVCFIEALRAGRYHPQSFSRCMVIGIGPGFMVVVPITR